MTKWAFTAVVLLALAQPGDPDALVDETRARMYPMPSAEVWRVVPQALKAINLAFPRTIASAQFAIAWQLQPMNLPQERRSELRVFVSPYAEPARVYAGSIMREPSPDDSRILSVRYNTGELESAFFAALEKILGHPGERVPLDAGRRAATAHRLLGAAADSDPCLKRLEEDEPFGMNPDGGVMAPQKIPETEAVPVAPGRRPRDKAAGQPRIDATITEDGALVGARLVQMSSRDDAFASAVLGAASLWHYQPVKIDGCYVPVRLTLAVQSK